MPHLGAPQPPLPACTLIYPSSRFGGGGGLGGPAPGRCWSLRPKNGRARATCTLRSQADRRQPSAPAGRSARPGPVGLSCPHRRRGRALAGAGVEVDLGCGALGDPGVSGVQGSWEGAQAGTGVPPPAERRIGRTWGRIGRRRTRRSGWCGPRRAPPATTPWTSPPGCAPRRGAACAAAAARIRSQRKSFFALLRNTALSLSEQKKACFRVGVRAPGRARPLPAAPGMAAA